MATKGASNRYGTPRGKNSKSNPNGVNYEWAKDFNKKTLVTHFNEHAKELNLESKESYKQHAIKFANTVDTKINIAFVDKKGTTYKFNKKTNELVIVKKDGIIVSYYKVDKKFYYYNKKGEKVWYYVKKK